MVAQPNDDPSRPGRVILTMTALDGDMLELVRYPDGGCALLRNGQPVTDIRHLPCPIGECVEQLLRLGWRP